MDNTIPRDVQMQFMRPAQLEAAARRFPAVYVPFGLIEWHGPQLPLGNDALKAHAILVKAAEQAGGVVCDTAGNALEMLATESDSFCLHVLAARNADLQREIVPLLRPC